MLKQVEKLTDAEQAMLEASESMGDNGVRSAAACLLRSYGLPTRRVEAWHYTDLRNRLKTFDGVSAPAEEGEAEEWLGGVEEFMPSHRLAFVNGRHVAAGQPSLPDGLKFDAGAAAAGYRSATDAVALTNSMLAGDGVRLSVASGTKLAEPVEILHGAISPGASVVRHAVEIRPGASAIIVERHRSADDLNAQTNTVTGLTLHDGASADWIIAQEEGAGVLHLAQLNVTMREGSRLNIFVLNAGGAFVRREINVAVRGEGAELSIRGVNLVGGESHVDITTSLVHEAPHTTSTEIFRNVATARGRGVFQGEIKVARLAQKTDARMACNTLLLSDEAEFSAKPELEIFADDVQCGHGATVTDILDDHLFYLRARGIPEREARALLVKAFVEEVFDEIEDERLHEALNDRIEKWLDANG